VLQTLAGWTSLRITEAFGVREDTVRLWRGDFMRSGVKAPRATVAPGPTPVKSEAALRVAVPLLEEPVADRHNWTAPACAPRSKRARAFASARPSAATTSSPIANNWTGSTIQSQGNPPGRWC